MGGLPPRTALVVATALLAAGPAADGHAQTLSSTNSVRVGDVGSNAPLGCGKRAALSGGFANEFDRETSRLLLFGFNATGRFTSLLTPGHPSPIPGGPSWRVTVANMGEGSRGAGRQTTFVYCDRRQPGRRVRWARVAIGPSANATATVTCPRGTEAVSGGFSDRYAGTNGSLVFGYRSRRVGRRGWRASAVNMSASVSSTFMVHAVCDPSRPGLSAREKAIEVPALGTGSARVRCGGGHKAWSAGFESEVELPGPQGAFPYELRRVRRGSWRASAFAEGRAARFTLHVYCGLTPSPAIGQSKK